MTGVGVNGFAYTAVASAVPRQDFAAMTVLAMWHRQQQQSQYRQSHESVDSVVVS